MELSTRTTGLAGLLAAVLVGAGEFALHFDPLARFTGYDYMASIPDSRLTLGHFLAVIGMPFYFIGAWHIFQMLRSAGPRLAFVGFLTTCFGFVFGAVWMGSRASIGSLVHHAALIEETNLVALYELRYESLLQVIRITTLALSVIYVYLAWTGRSRYPRWMVAVNPFLLIVASFVLFVAWKDVGKYVMPIALNVAFAIFFICSLRFGRPPAPQA
ncbi:MAG: hypothetical protein JRJ24_21070 [Deltaproteobacteria bacterium]|nr:hypothetical protein [Deltaproteobacteria bacterium]